MVAGAAAVTFMLLFVVPVFQKTYDDAGRAAAAGSRRFLIAAGRLGQALRLVRAVGR